MLESSGTFLIALLELFREILVSMEEDNQENKSAEQDVEGSSKDQSLESENSQCHTHSESSGASLEQGSSSRSKNLHVALSSSPINGFFFPGIPASPPKFVSLAQIMKAANGVSDMALAHEIAVNGDFMLDKIEPEDTIEKQVKEVVHKAFWDVLQAQLNEDPPNYTQAMILLNEVKENLLSILMPHHTRILNQINEVLDIALIQQQAENDALDFKYYAQYIISVMSRLCAPVRDEKIKELASLTDVVSVYRGILETLSLMKLDMANFTIQQFRPHIQQHSVEYERKKFQEFLDMQAALAAPVDGLEYTRKWLKQSYEKILESSPEQQPSHMDILNKAYLELLEWKDDAIFPEALLLDQTRFLALRDQVLEITLKASIVLVTFSTVGEAIHGISDFKTKLVEHLNVLLDSVKCSEEELQEKLKNVGLQVVQEASKCLIKHGYAALSGDTEKILLGQISDLSSPKHCLRELIKKRLFAFLEAVLSPQAAGQQKIPPGLSAFQKDVSRVTGLFFRLVEHNRLVMGDYYLDITTNLKQQKEQN